MAGEGRSIPGLAKWELSDIMEAGGTLLIAVMRFSSLPGTVLDHGAGHFYSWPFTGPVFRQNDKSCCVTIL